MLRYCSLPTLHQIADFPLQEQAVAAAVIPALVRIELFFGVVFSLLPRGSPMPESSMFHSSDCSNLLINGRTTKPLSRLYRYYRYFRFKVSQVSARKPPLSHKVPLSLLRVRVRVLRSVRNPQQVILRARLKVQLL